MRCSGRRPIHDSCSWVYEHNSWKRGPRNGRWITPDSRRPCGSGDRLGFGRIDDSVLARGIHSVCQPNPCLRRALHAGGVALDPSFGGRNGLVVPIRRASRCNDRYHVQRVRSSGTLQRWCGAALVFLPTVIGIFAALAVGVFATLSRFDRDRAFYPTVLIVIASYYCLFAIMGRGSVVLLGYEVAALFAFAALAVLGFKTSLWVVVAGLAAHGFFDLVRSDFLTNPGVPVWWPIWCLAFDVAAAAYLAWRLISTPTTRRSNVSDRV